MSGRPIRHSRKPSTGIPTQFMADEVESQDLKNNSNSNSPPPLPVSPPTPRQHHTNNKPPPHSASAPDS